MGRQAKMRSALKYSLGRYILGLSLQLALSLRHSAWTDRLPGVTLWSKTVMWLTGWQEWPSGPKPCVTDRLPEETLWSTTVSWLTGCHEWPPSPKMSRDLTGCQERPSNPKPTHDWQAAKKDPLVQNGHVTDRLPGKTLWSKTVT